MTAQQEAKLKEMERRLQELEDKENIRECLARYSFNADLGRSEEYVNNYTADGVIDLGPTTKWSGRDGLLDFIANPHGGHKAIEGHCMHTSMDFFIRVDGNKAWAEGYSVVYVKEGEGEREGYRVFSIGFNHWDFEKRGDRWFLKYRYRRPMGGPEWGGKVIKDYLKD
jgi:hypothetical protein